MTMVPGPAAPEVVLATSARALALMAEHALAWRRGHCLPGQVMIGAACPGCGSQVAAVLARVQFRWHLDPARVVADRVPCLSC